MFYLLFFAFVLVICFFVLFILARQDFVLLRQNISLAEIFDLSVLIIIFSFIFGRIFFIINEFEFYLLNILNFFHLIKFPGISGLGFFLGGALALYILLKGRKGLERIFDIFSISFFPLYVFFLLYLIVSFTPFYIPIIVFLPMLVILYLFFRWHSKYFLKDGSISLIFLLLISINSAIIETVAGFGKPIFLSLSFTQIISIPIALIALIFLSLNQKRFK